jgi:hypothetical protein
MRRWHLGLQQVLRWRCHVIAGVGWGGDALKAQHLLVQGDEARVGEVVWVAGKRWPSMEDVVGEEVARDA